MYSFGLKGANKNKVNEINHNSILLFHPTKHLEEDKLDVTLEETNCLINEIILFHSSEKYSWDQSVLYPKNHGVWYHCDFSVIFQTYSIINNSYWNILFQNLLYPPIDSNFNEWMIW